MTELVAVKGADFAGTAFHEEARIRVKLEGNADHLVVDMIGKFFERVHAEAVRLGVTEAVVDFMNLEFMNSSCFKVLVTWLNDIRELEPASQYKIVFVSNPQIHWQKRSLHSLRCFASELITIS
jgi:hypothetical protein